MKVYIFLSVLFTVTGVMCFVGAASAGVCVQLGEAVANGALDFCRSGGVMGNP